MEKQVDVVVVGAGPVGLLTAIELSLRGVRGLVLERLAAPSLAMKAGGIGPLGSEALQRRGMAAAFAAAETRSFAAIKKFTDKSGPDVRGKGSKFIGHFAGLSLIRKDAQKEPERRSHPVDQQAVEAMLTGRAHALGIEVRRECEVTNFVQQADGVDVEWISPIGEGRIRCSYLVGCDGGRSPQPRSPSRPARSPSTPPWPRP
jgi:2-polyprenyl-6-methoxyphenol hydroxylase-like FAD-dependent oxidoreductase